MSSTIKHTLDLFFVFCAFIGMVLSSVIPVLAALASLLWYSIRVYQWWEERKKNGNVGNH